MTVHRPVVIKNGLIAHLGDDDTLMLPVVTALRLLGVDANKAVISVNLAAFIRSAGSSIVVQDDGAGGVTISLPQIFIVKLLGDNDTVVAGSATDLAWDGAAPAPTWTSVWKAVVARLEAVRALLAGTVKVDGSAVTQPVSPKQFCPTATVKLSVGATSVSAALTAGTTVLRLYNSGPSPVFVRWGTGAQTATINDMPLASGASETFGKATTHDTIAAISSGMGTLYVTAGNRV